MLPTADPPVLQRPELIPNLLLWLSGDRGAIGQFGSGISAWRDKSGRGNDLTQATPGSQPTLTRLGMHGHSALSFDGADTGGALGPTNNTDFLDSGLTLALKPVTVFAAVNLTNIAGYRALVGPAANNSGFLMRVNQTDQKITILASQVAGIATSNFTVPLGVPVIIGVTYDASGNYGFYLNSPYPDSSGTNNVTIVSDAVRIGADKSGTSIANTPWLGQIGDLFLANRVLSASERTLIVRYLSGKYQIPAKVPPIYTVTKQRVAYPAQSTVSASGTATLDLTASGTTAAPVTSTASLSLSAGGTTAAPVTSTASLDLTAAGTAAALFTSTGTLNLTAAGTVQTLITSAAMLTLSASGIGTSDVPNVRGYSRSTFATAGSSSTSLTSIGSSHTTLATVGSSTASVQ